MITENENTETQAAGEVRSVERYIESFGAFYGPMWFGSGVRFADAEMIYERVRKGDSLQSGRPTPKTVAQDRR